MQLINIYYFSHIYVLDVQKKFENYLGCVSLNLNQCVKNNPHGQLILKHKHVTFDIWHEIQFPGFTIDRIIVMSTVIRNTII